MDNFLKALRFVGLAEGGYTDNRNDKGNWTGGEIGKGELKGTKYGISAASYKHLDIKNLTKDEANAIYKRDYWDAIDGDTLPWPLALVAFDHAVNAGVSRAKKALELYSDPFVYIAERLKDYTGYSGWEHFSKGWTRRMADLMMEVHKELEGLEPSRDKAVSTEAEVVTLKGGDPHDVSTLVLNTPVGPFVLRLPVKLKARVREDKVDFTL